MIDAESWLSFISSVSRFCQKNVSSCRVMDGGRNKSVCPSFLARQGEISPSSTEGLASKQGHYWCVVQSFLSIDHHADLRLIDSFARSVPCHTAEAKMECTVIYIVDLPVSKKRYSYLLVLFIAQIFVFINSHSPHCVHASLLRTLFVQSTQGNNKQASKKQ